MAGPQAQRKQQQQQQLQQRPTSAYYASATETTSTTNGLATSSSYAGLHALRQISNESELIYRGSNGNTFASHNDCVGDGGGVAPSTSHRRSSRTYGSSTSCRMEVKCENGCSGGVGGNNAGNRDASTAAAHEHATKLGIRTTTATMTMTANPAVVQHTNPCTIPSAMASSSSCSDNARRPSLRQQRSVEIMADATGCDGSDIEQGQTRKPPRHRRRPLHRRLLNYLRSLFQGSDTAHDSELEDYETPVRYRPDSLSALSRSTRFTQDEIKRIYRGFKAECPTGVVKEDTFKVIYSQFFPQGGSYANPSLYAHYVFNTLDQDHTGNVSFEEFVQGLSILSRGSIDEKLRWTFSLYDINGDGCITREEMTDIVTAIFELTGRHPDEIPAEERIKYKVEHIFRKMDTNRDGVVTLDEFLEACRNDETISRSMSVFDTAF